jgi:Putative beta-barrel porin 2
MAVAFGAAVPALAQSPEGGPDPAKVRVRIGPLWMNPTVSLTNFGIDQNVFNEPDSASPKQDLTLTATPNTDVWIRVGPSWVDGSVKEELVWYQTYATERAANSMYRIGWKLPLNRLAFDVGGSYANVRDRPGFEIDARSLRIETTVNGSVEVRTLSKTFFGARAERLRTNFDKDAVFLTSNLHTELNHVTTNTGFFVRHQLTPLTSVMVTASRIQDRFDFSSLRDSDSNIGAVSLTFDPFALIKGSLTVGYRDFRPSAAGLADFRGLTTAVNLSYTATEMTKFSVKANRDIEYSFDTDQPYYLLTGVEGSIAQQVFGPVDVAGRLGFQSLAYRDRAGAVVTVADRVDRVRTYGVGVGYHLSRDLRVGVNVDRSQRDSDVAHRQYAGLRIGTAVTYGL